MCEAVSRCDEQRERRHGNVVDRSTGVDRADQLKRSAVLAQDGERIAASRVRHAVTEAQEVSGAGNGDSGDEPRRIDRSIVERNAVRRCGPKIIAVDRQIENRAAELIAENGSEVALREGG